MTETHIAGQKQVMVIRLSYEVLVQWNDVCQEACGVGGANRIECLLEGPVVRDPTREARRFRPAKAVTANA